jgi:hypothetical protein
MYQLFARPAPLLAPPIARKVVTGLNPNIKSGSVEVIRLGFVLISSKPCVQAVNIKTAAVITILVYIFFFILIILQD